MAKFECSIKENFESALEIIENGVLSGSASASLEDSSYFTLGDVRCAIRVFEHYSFAGGNRLSLTITLFGNDGDLKLSAITSGGSQAVFFKINTIGEESFLDNLRIMLEESIMDISNLVNSQALF